MPLNKVSKDIIVRSVCLFESLRTRLGYYGLPIEQVLAKQGVKRKEMDLLILLKCVSTMPLAR